MHTREAHKASGDYEMRLHRFLSRFKPGGTFTVLGLFSERSPRLDDPSHLDRQSDEPGSYWSCSGESGHWLLEEIALLLLFFALDTEESSH